MLHDNCVSLFGAAIEEKGSVIVHYSSSCNLRTSTCVHQAALTAKVPSSVDYGLRCNNLSRRRAKTGYFTNTMGPWHGPLIWNFHKLVMYHVRIRGPYLQFHQAKDKRAGAQIRVPCAKLALLPKTSSCQGREKRTMHLVRSDLDIVGTRVESFVLFGCP